MPTTCPSSTATQKTTPAAISIASSSAGMYGSCQRSAGMTPRYAAAASLTIASIVAKSDSVVFRITIGTVPERQEQSCNHECEHDTIDDQHDRWRLPYGGIVPMEHLCGEKVQRQESEHRRNRAAIAHEDCHADEKKEQARERGVRVARDDRLRHDRRVRGERNPVGARNGVVRIDDDQHRLKRP